MSFLAMLAPYRYVILALAVFMAGWVAQGWRLNGEISEIREEQATAAREFERASRAKEQEWSKRLQGAQNAAKSRETKLRNDAVFATDNSSRLRNEIIALRGQLSELSADAVIKRADTLGELFNECQQAYRELAEKATGHANDIQTLTDSWPN